MRWTMLYLIRTGPGLAQPAGTGGDHRLTVEIADWHHLGWVHGRTRRNRLCGMAVKPTSSGSFTEFAILVAWMCCSHFHSTSRPPILEQSRAQRKPRCVGSGWPFISGKREQSRVGIKRSGSRDGPLKIGHLPAGDIGAIEQISVACF